MNFLLAVDEQLSGLTRLRVVNLAQNSITRVSDVAFCGTALASLNLRANQLQAVPALQCVAQSLVSLNLANNNISSLDGGFYGFDALQHLDLAVNRLLAIESFAFQQLSNLTHLTLKSNPIATVHSNAFCNTSLVELEMNEMKLTSFPDIRCVVDTLETLGIFYQDGTEITDFTNVVPTRAMTTVTIKVRDAPPDPSVSDLFAYAGKATIDCQTGFDSIDLTFLENATELYHLVVVDCQLPEVPDLTPLQNSIIHTLRFAGSRITSLNGSEFAALPRLRSLNLGENRLFGTLTPDMLPLHHDQMESLLIYNNPNVSLSSDFISSFPSLKSLNAWGTGITQFPDFSEARARMTLINLEHSDLNLFDADVLADMPNLHTLRLRSALHEGQRLPNLTAALEQGSLSSVYIGDNTIVCDCALQWALDAKAGVYGDRVVREVQIDDVVCSQQSPFVLQGQLLDDLNITLCPGMNINM